MVTAYYAAVFGVSVIMMIMYVFLYHRHYDIHISLIFVLVPISNLGYFIISQSESLEAALLANKVVYIGGCYTILMIVLVVFNLCEINLNRYIKLIMYLVTTAVFCSTLFIGENELYYKSASLSRENGVTVIVKEYGVLHTVYYIMMTAYFLLALAGVFYGYFRKNQVSNRFITLVALPGVLCFISYFGGSVLSKAFGLFTDIELVPLFYDLALVVYLIITHKLVIYNLYDTVVNSFVQNGDTGFISFDFRFRYLGSNETAKSIFPELIDQTIDKAIRSASLKCSILQWMDDFSRDSSCNEFSYRKDEKTYLVNIRFLSDGSHNRGYQMTITDDTKNQQYIALLDSYNTELIAEVDRKTEHIVEMQDNLILGMAVMVESRDNSTGGHIRRTSECVRILTHEIKGGEDFTLSEQFCHDIIKAAPMHDLGKIAVDDAILRKPGRFTDEEFAIMKTHAAEGARIVHEILKGTDDEEFRNLAENVAHYHHERWDGSGYPDGLKGEQIPLEARIMAIADVYDALVSKRVYKEKMSLEKADQIIMEGMGKHFDKRLEPYYIAARPKLEQYYIENDERSAE